MKKIGYVVWFNILLLSFVCTDLINETAWLKDTLYGITWIALLFVVLYFKKNNFDKMILLIVELILLGRKNLSERVRAVWFGNLESAERIVWSIIVVMLFVLFAILSIYYILKKRDRDRNNYDEFAVSSEEEGDAFDEERARNGKAVWIIGLLLFSVSGYLLYLYQVVYLGKSLDITIHEDAIFNLVNYLVQYVLFIGGILIVIGLIVNSVEVFLLDKCKGKNEKRQEKETGEDQKAEKAEETVGGQKAETVEETVRLTKRIFLFSLYIMLLISYLEYKQVLSVDAVINVLTNNTSGIVSVVLVFLYVGIVMIVSLVIAILVELRNSIKESFIELAKDILEKCKNTLKNIVNFIAFITVDLFSAVIDLLVGESEDKPRDREKGEPSDEVIAEEQTEESSVADTANEE